MIIVSDMELGGGQRSRGGGGMGGRVTGGWEDPAQPGWGSPEPRDVQQVGHPRPVDVQGLGWGGGKGVRWGGADPSCILSGGGGQGCRPLGVGGALTGRRMKNMVRAPTMGTSPRRGSRMIRSIPWSWGGSSTEMSPPPHGHDPPHPASSPCPQPPPPPSPPAGAETPPHLHALHPRLAEELLHLHVDLDVTHVAEEMGT